MNAMRAQRCFTTRNMYMNALRARRSLYLGAVPSLYRQGHPDPGRARDKSQNPDARDWASATPALPASSPGAPPVSSPSRRAPASSP
eukprot:1982776-Prymnesium_polylepis.1